MTQSVRAQGRAFLLPLPAPFSHKQKRGFKKRKKRAAGRGTRRPHRLCIKHFTSRSPSSASMPSLLRQDAIRHARPEAEKAVLNQFKVEGCPYCRTNSRGGVSSAFSTSSATARKRQRGVRRGCFSILHANRPESHSANLIPVTRCGRRCCTTTSASSCSLWMNSWRFWRSAEGNFSFGSG